MDQITRLIKAHDETRQSIDAAPDPEDVPADIHDAVFGVVVNLSNLMDTIQARLIELQPCPTCKGTGGWEDCGPNDGCSEFAPCQFIECQTCHGEAFARP